MRSIPTVRQAGGGKKTRQSQSVTGRERKRQDMAVKVVRAGRVSEKSG